MRTVSEVLQSVSDVLFPAELGSAPVTVNSRSSEGDTPLHVMAWRNDVEGAHMLLAAGADVNAIGDMDETALHVAIRQEDLPMIEMFLSAGARVDAVSEFGKTPVQEAEVKGGTILQVIHDHTRA